MEQYIRPFVEVSKDVFREFVGLEAAEGRPYLADALTLAEWDISAVIGFSGDACGAVAVSMGKELALALTDILTGTSHGNIDDDVTDAVGEIVNLIAGKVKKDLEGFFRPVISLPVVTCGEESAAAWPGSRTRIICIPFTVFDNKTFVLSVSIEAAEKQG